MGPPPDSPTGEASAMVHPLLRHHAWDKDMARKNAMALDPDLYMAKITEAKKTAFWRIKDKLKNMDLVSTADEASSDLSSGVRPHSATPIQQTEKFPSLDGEARRRTDTRNSQLTKEDPSPSGSCRSSVSASILTRDFTHRPSLPRTPSESETRSDLDRNASRPGTPQIDFPQPGSSTWGLSRLLPKSAKQSKINAKHTLQRARAFTSDTATSTSSASSILEGAGAIPPPHKLQRMPSYTGLDDPPVPPHPQSRRGTVSGKPITAVVANNASRLDTGSRRTSDASIRTSSFAITTAASTNATGAIDPGSISGAGHSTSIITTSSSRGPRKASTSTKSSTSDPTGINRHWGLTRGQPGAVTEILGSGGHGGGDSNPRDSKGSDASRVSVDFDSRRVAFNDPALQFPKNKVTRAQVVIAEQVYEDNMERIRSHAIERARAEKEHRPSKAPYTRHGYICADEPGQDFRLVYEPPSNEEVARYSAFPRPPLCGPIIHDPNPYLDPLVQKIEHERKSSLQKRHLMPQAYEAQKIQRPQAPDPSADHKYEYPRPAPRPPIQQQQARAVCPENSFHRPKVLPYHGLPLPPLTSAPPTRPLPIPPIEPGTSRRLSQETRYYGGNKADDQGRGRDNDDKVVDEGDPCPRPLVPKPAKEATSRFGLATAQLRAYASARDANQSRPQFPLRARPSNETIVSDNSQDNHSDHLSTIDEKSETRSVTVVRGGQSFDPLDSNLGPVAERLSFEDTTINPRDLDTSKHEAVPGDYPRSRRFSAPSIYQAGEKTLLADDATADPGGDSVEETSSDDLQDTFAVPKSSARDPEDPFQRPLPPLPLCTGTGALTTPKRRARSFSHVEASPPPGMGTQNTENWPLVGTRPCTPPDIGVYAENDTPVRIRQRLQMRQHQESLLDIEHAAFGGPPHRDLQGRNCRLNPLAGPPCPPPSCPLPPNPPPRSPYRGQSMGPSTPKNKAVRNMPELARPVSAIVANTAGEVRQMDFSNSPFTAAEEKGHRDVPFTTPSIRRYGTWSRDGSTMSIQSQEASDSAGRRQPREAGYAISPLRIKKNTVMPVGAEAPEGQETQSVQRKHSEMQDIIDAINMGADEIDQARQEKLASGLDDHVDKNNLEVESSTHKKSTSFRGDTNRASGSIRDLLKSGFSQSQSHDSSRSDDGHRVSMPRSVGKSSVKSSVKSTVGLGATAAAASTTSGPGSVISSSEGDRPSTSHSKTGVSFFNKLKTKASFDVLRRRRSFVKGRQPHGSSSSDSSTPFTGTGASSICPPVTPGKNRDKESAELMAGMGDPSPTIPPLPNMGRLTMTIAVEDLERYGIKPDDESYGEVAPSSNSELQAEDDRKDQRQKALEKLRGHDPDHLESVPEGEIITNPFKKDGGNQKPHGIENVPPMPKTPATQRLRLAMPTKLWGIKPSRENLRQDTQKSKKDGASKGEEQGEPKATLTSPVSVNFGLEPGLGPSRVSLVTVEEALLGSRSPPPPMPPLPLAFGPPTIPPRRGSKGSPAKALSIPRVKRDSGSPRRGKIPQFVAPPSSKQVVNKASAQRLMKKPSYGQMPARGGGHTHTPIDITKHATANPSEALSSPATVMSLAPKIGGNKVVQDKSLAMASALPKIPTPMPTPGPSSGRISPIKRLRNAASASALGSGMGMSQYL